MKWLLGNDREIISEIVSLIILVIVGAILVFILTALVVGGFTAYDNRVMSEAAPIQIEEQGELLRFVTYKNTVECPNIPTVQAIAARVASKPGRGHIVVEHKRGSYLIIEYLTGEKSRIVVPVVCSLIEQ